MDLMAELRFFVIAAWVLGSFAWYHENNLVRTHSKDHFSFDSSIGSNFVSSNDLNCQGYVFYDFNLTRKDIKGTGKLQVAINGQVPGPTMRFQRGQCIQVTVHNNLAFEEGTTVHFHGIFQRKTPFSDGVIGASQCVIPTTTSESKNVMVYNFGTDYQTAGTYWYHGHYHEQYPDGLYGAIVVEDPLEIKAYSIDNDLWTWNFADWYNVISRSLLSQYLIPASQGNEPIPDAYVVNNMFIEDNFTVFANRTEGVIRLRLLNSAIYSMCNISIDGLPLTVIEIEGTAMKPLDVGYIVLNVGQRVSVLLNFSRLDPLLNATDALWIRFTGLPDMYPTYDPSLADEGIAGATSKKKLNLNWVGRIIFNGDKTTIPKYNTTHIPFLNYTPITTNIVSARPLVPRPDITASHYIHMQVVFQNDSYGVNRAYINGDYYTGNFTNITSTTNYVMKTMYDDSYRSFLANIANSQPYHINGSSMHPFIVPFNKTIEIFINNTDTGEHPFHFHGHNFEIIATSADPQAENLYKGNYVVRDVVSVPALGWAKIRYRSDNPGAWVMHCHIEWHVAAGLLGIFIEAPDLLSPQYMANIPTSQISACPDIYAIVNTKPSKKNSKSGYLGTALTKTGFFVVIGFAVVVFILFMFTLGLVYSRRNLFQGKLESSEVSNRMLETNETLNESLISPSEVVQI